MTQIDTHFSWVTLWRERERERERERAAMTSRKTLRRRSLTLALADGAANMNEGTTERMKVGTSHFFAVGELFFIPEAFILFL